MPQFSLLPFLPVRRVLHVAAVGAIAKLPALDSLLVAEAVVFLALGFLASAEDNIPQPALSGVFPHEVVHVLAGTTPDFLEHLKGGLPHF